MRGGLRGAIAAWLGLIALHAVGTQAGSGRIAGAFDDLNEIVTRVLDPKVPAIRDRRVASAAPAEAPAATGYQPPLGPYASDGTGLQPNTGPQLGPYNPNGTGLQPQTWVPAPVR